MQGKADSILGDKMKAICAACKNEKLIVKDNLCAACLMARVLTAKATPTLKLDTPIVAIAAKKNICDACEQEFNSPADLKKFENTNLNLCSACFTIEHNAAIELRANTPEPGIDPKNYATWPRCTECHAHVREPIEGKCPSCTRKPTKIDPILVKPTDSNKYQEFFNQEAQSITEMLKELGEEAGIAKLRQSIIDQAEDLFSQEQGVLKTKSQLQSKKVKWNDLLSKLSVDKQNELRIEDANYTPKSGEPRKLKSPMAQIEKTKKLKKSLDEQINNMFGGKLTEAEIAEKKKALGM